MYWFVCLCVDELVFVDWLCIGCDECGCEDGFVLGL